MSEHERKKKQEELMHEFDIVRHPAQEFVGRLADIDKPEGDLGEILKKSVKEYYVLLSKLVDALRRIHKRRNEKKDKLNKAVAKAREEEKKLDTRKNEFQEEEEKKLPVQSAEESKE